MGFLDEGHGQYYTGKCRATGNEGTFPVAANSRQM
jgi:hypothetical protein